MEAGSNIELNTQIDQESNKIERELRNYLKQSVIVRTTDQQMELQSLHVFAIYQETAKGSEKLR